MEIKYTRKAFASLVKLINFIEGRNTRGAGIRWAEKYNAFIKEKFERVDSIKLCNNKSFYIRQLRCIYYNDWVIAFSVESKNTIIIRSLLHKSRLID